ncbi:(2Fe-2S)-binding protein [Actinoplanes sp. SE50]|uniref:(2Fe-2S)-binding protein n=1 Tax=unclassified Actinoplanes TaxID=2626549 RepID=UPI00023EC419|nr:MULTISPECIES: (2Fe-2S)-binding protein [unclassified Actinoplanes]AEV83043.1 BFD domain-containing protein (2Fe-2S)-binding domain-containing protein [Actinoplanes sp. SE50/110]ATO81439.1 (2Fe-2S)-binding protein [Actinoplanes sp. SE50]SLL98846.1 (2Fe-2S)-binding protein [Actinoplanes sp. SE50/110]
MFVCICHHVRERDVRTAIRCGARTEASVGDACGAGTGCGSCLDRIADLIEEEGCADTRLPSAA